MKQWGDAAPGRLYALRLPHCELSRAFVGTGARVIGSMVLFSALLNEDLGDLLIGQEVGGWCGGGEYRGREAEQ
jgi:hypothetical protein